MEAAARGLDCDGTPNRLGRELDELADVLMSRYEKLSTIIASNRALDDWAKLLGDVPAAACARDQ